MAKTQVLFLCTQNSARSQMAGAPLREHGGDHFEVHSAGCRVYGELYPYAAWVMEEIGIDISDLFHTRLLSRLRSVLRSILGPTSCSGPKVSLVSLPARALVYRA